MTLRNLVALLFGSCEEEVTSLPRHHLQPSFPFCIFYNIYLTQQTYLCISWACFFKVKFKILDITKYCDFYFEIKTVWITIFFSRKGAPFYKRFQQLMLSLEAAGITKQWTEEVIERRVKENTQEGSQLSAGMKYQVQVSWLVCNVWCSLNHNYLLLLNRLSKRYDI